ncbi:MAG: serine/threonine protein kinase [Planctomycetaceae bacterium]|nr:serine/threonine protein kinase [Planctomycetaceae bacterium]
MTDNRHAHSDCRFTEALGQLVAGSLPADEERRLTDHISWCEECQQALDALPPAELVRQAQGSRHRTGKMPQALSQLLHHALADVRESLTDTRPDVSDLHNAGADILPWLDTADDGSLGKAGPYRLTKLLGRGGMGAVFLGHDDELDRQVAVKMLSPGLIADTTSRERFLREARAVAAIAHPSIVAIHRVESGDKLPWFAMEYVPGKSLEQHLTDGRRISATQVIRIGYQVATALAAAHGASLIHRDIKPGNILIEDESGRVRLLDFGLARNTAGTGLTTSGTLLGTPSYMAPETIAEQPQDERTDLYALGAVLYHLLAGAPPFQADTVVGTIYAISRGEFPPLARNSNAPVELLRIVERLLQSDPNQRFQTASEVATALRALRKGGTSAAATEKSGTLSVTPAQMIGAVVVALLLIVAVARPWADRLDDSSAAPSTGPTPSPPADPAVPGIEESRIAQSMNAQAARGKQTDTDTSGGVDQTPGEHDDGVRDQGATADVDQASDTDTAAASEQNRLAATDMDEDPIGSSFRFCREDGSIAGRATSLEDAVRGVPDGGTVYIATAETVVLEEPIFIGDKSLAIVGDPELSQIEVRFREAAPVFEAEQTLKLERLRIVHQPNLADEEQEDLALVALNGGQLYCHGCEFAQPDGAVCWINAAASAEFDDCRLWVPLGSAVRCSSDQAPPQIEFSECQIVCYTALLVEPALPTTITIEQSQVVGEFLMTIDLDEQDAPLSPLTDCRVTDSVLCTSVGICQVITHRVSQAASGIFRWRGDHNTSTSPLLLVSGVDAEEDDPIDRTDVLLRRPENRSDNGVYVAFEQVEDLLDDEGLLQDPDEATEQFAKVMDELQRHRQQNQ